MYTPIAMRQLPRNDVFVIADTSTAHIINLFASVLVARNPLITAPPHHSKIWKEAGDHTASASLLAALNRAVVDPFFLRVGKADESATLVPESAQPWLLAVSNLGLSGPLSFPRVYLKQVAVVQDALATLQDEGATSMSSIDVTNSSLAKIIEADTLRVPFAQLAVTLAYEQIIKSGAFDKLTQPDDTGFRTQYTVIERGILLATMLQVLSVQTVLLRIRPLLRFLRTDQAKGRLREEMMPTTLEYWEAIIDRILGIPVHPWIARAEEASLPANRMTPWGDSTPTILMERGFLNSPWDGKGSPTIEERAAWANEMRPRIDPPALLASLEGLLRDLRRFFDDMDQGGHFQKIAAMFNFTSPRSPLNVPLWGTAIKPIHLDGLNSTEAIPSIVALTYQPHLPAQGGKGSPWIGEDMWAHYYGADRMDSTPTVWSEFSGAISVAPEDIVMDSAYYTAKLTPEMLRPKATAFMGDLNDVTVPSTPEAVGTVFGRTEREMFALVQAAPARWSHIFTIEGDRLRSKLNGDLLFYSPRTQMPWLTTITLPRRGCPTVMWALRRGQPETALPVQARFLRDTVVPTATIPMTSAVESLIKDAIPVQLTGVR